MDEDMGSIPDDDPLAVSESVDGYLNMGTSIALGAAIGMVLGTMLGSVSWGLIIGAAIGAAAGSIVETKRARG